MRGFGLLLLLFAGVFVAVPIHAQTVVFHDVFPNTTDLQRNWCWQAAPRCLLARPATVVTCPNASPFGTTTCVQIAIGSGDKGNNLLGPCFVSNVTGCSNNGFNLQGYPTFYVFYHMYISGGNATFGANSENAKFGYLKNSAGGGVCYWDLGVDTQGPAARVSGRTICDNPADQGPNAPYVSISTAAGWHTVEAEYSSGKFLQLWYDGKSLGIFPRNYPAETLPVQLYTDFEPGLYSNSAVTTNWDLDITDFEICTGARCPNRSGGK
jgi:hypothetical protein